MVESGQSDANPGVSAGTTHLAEYVDRYLTSKGKGEGGQSGSYRSVASSVLGRFIGWVDDRDGVDPTFEALGPQVLRRWVRDDLVADDGLSARSVRTYYNVVAAYLGWCVREGVLGSNPARTHTAEEELPDVEQTRVGQQQSWDRNQRQALCAHVDDAVYDALDADGPDGASGLGGGNAPIDALKELRDRALVYILCYSGVRGGEILAVPEDGRRNGIRWADVDLEEQVVWVLSKKQVRDDRPLTPKPIRPLRQLKRVLDPEPYWPVLPTLSWPTLYQVLREELAARGRDEEGIEAFVDNLNGRTDVFDAYRDLGVAPSSLSTNGARHTLKRLTGAAEIDLEDGHDYLQPHGARRGVGAVLVKQRGFDAAASQLDNSVRVVEDFYSELKATEQSEDVGRAFDEHDG